MFRLYVVVLVDFITINKRHFLGNKLVKLGTKGENKSKKKEIMRREIEIERKI